MAVRAISLNLSQAHTTLSPMSSRPIEFPAGNEFYKPESGATGGSAFQRHRLFRTYAYAMNCIKTESGFSSVAPSSFRSQKFGEGNHSKLAYISDCFSDRENLIAYDPKLYHTTSSVNGSVITDRCNHEAFISDGTVEGLATFKDLDVKAIVFHHPDVVGIVRAHAYVIWWTKSQLFYNGYEDLEDYTPSLSTGGGSTSVTFELGSIVKVLPNRKGVYVFGTKGAIYGSFTRDVKYPFDFNPVVNHDGILNGDAVGFDYEVDSFVIMSHSGLQRIQGNTAEMVLEDISRSLQRGVNININLTGAETASLLIPKKSNHTQLHVNVDDEYRDDTYSSFDFYDEFVDCSDKIPHVLVSNISPRYTLISYAKVGDYYNRLLVIDHRLKGSTVLHILHTDTIRPRHGYAELFVLMGYRSTFSVKEGGDGLLLFIEFQKTSGKATTFSRCVGYGRFSEDLVSESDYFNSIHFLKGFDQINSDYLPDTLRMVGHSSREVTYAGRVTDKVLSFAIPFSGDMTEIVFDYK